jgi:hypothetical protein
MVNTRMARSSGTRGGIDGACWINMMAIEDALFRNFLWTK